MIRTAEWKAERINGLRELLTQLLFNPTGIDPETLEAKKKKWKVAQVAIKLIAQAVSNSNLSEEEGRTIISEVLDNVARAEKLMFMGDTENAFKLVQGERGHVKRIDRKVHGEADMYVTGQGLQEEARKLIEWLRNQGLVIKVI